MKRVVPLSLVVLTILTISAQAEDPVYFADAYLKERVESALDTSDPTPTDMLMLTELYAGKRQITDLTGLEYAQNLAYIDMQDNSITDLSPLSGLTTNLAHLDVAINQISDLSPISGLAGLRELSLSVNPIGDLSPLSGLTNLEKLNLGLNGISDISALSGLTELVSLKLPENRISDISPLSGLTELRGLNLSDNQISDISPLLPLTNLTLLDLIHNPLNDEAYSTVLPTILANGTYFSCDGRWTPPTNVSASDGTYANAVHIEWDPPRLSDGSYYRVYRSDSENGDKTSIGRWQTGTSYDDSTAEPSVTYYYWVTAALTDSGLNETGYSACDTGWWSSPFVSLTVSSSAGGSVTLPGEGVFDYSPSTSVSVTATPQANYHFTGWSGTAVTAGKVADAGAASTTVTMDGDYTLVAGFAIDQHALAISSSEGGSVTTPGEGAFVCDHGSVVSVEAAGQAGSEFTGWSGTAVDAGKVSNPDATSTTVTVDADYTLMANFALVEHTVLLSAGLGGSIIDPGEGSFTYTQGSEIQLEAQPDPGYDFDHWDGGTMWCDLNPFTITISGDLEIAAVFTAHQCRLTVSSSEGGAVVVPGEGVFAQTQGTSISAVAVPESGYCFAGWSGTLVEGDDVGALDIGRVNAVVNADATLHASFVPVSTCIYVDSQADDSGENGTWEHPFNTIQEAINVSDDGQTVLVLPGTYDENLTFSGEGITVSALDMRRSGAISQTIICGSGQGSVVTFADGESANSILSGFTIVGGNAEGGGGIRCIEASPIIANCVIAGNRADLGGGVLLDGGDATLVNCTICDNFGQLDGGGIYATGSGLVTDSILWDNEPQQIATESSAGLSLTYCDVKSGWPGTSNIDEVPCFAAPGYWTPNDDLDRPTEANDVDAVWSGGDYHLKSTAGRWELQSSSWVQDDLTSPCIDAGNPDADAQTETLPNGGRINLGAFGGTVEASMSQVDGAGE